MSVCSKINQNFFFYTCCRKKMSAHFPYTLKTDRGQVFGGTNSCYLTTDPVEGVEYRTVSPDGNRISLSVEKNYMGDINSVSSIMSSYEVASHLWNEKLKPRGITRMFLNLSDVNMDIKGASEGLATIATMLGFHVPENVIMTGYIEGFGQDGNPLRSISVRKVDCVAEKAKGVTEEGKLLIAPYGSTGVTKKENVVFVRTLGDLIDILQNLGVKNPAIIADSLI